MNFVTWNIVLILGGLMLCLWGLIGHSFHTKDRKHLAARIVSIGGIIISGAVFFTSLSLLFWEYIKYLYKQAPVLAIILVIDVLFNISLKT